MKNILFIALTLVNVLVYAQTNNEKLALAISNADDANTEKLKAYAWKRKSDVSVDGAVKLTIYTEFSFDAQGKLQAKITDADSNVKQKRGLRGRDKRTRQKIKLSMQRRHSNFQRLILSEQTLSFLFRKIQAKY